MIKVLIACILGDTAAGRPTLFSPLTLSLCWFVSRSSISSSEEEITGLAQCDLGAVFCLFLEGVGVELDLLPGREGEAACAGDGEDDR